MQTVTSLEAQNQFGKLIDKAQREPVTITRRGRPVAMVISMEDVKELFGQNAAEWYKSYRRKHADNARTADLTDEDVNRLVHELR
ncbi:MAG: type II toxin-antitoxin system prevent-host-death family antitoxin [Thiolinea sp.]